MPIVSTRCRMSSMIVYSSRPSKTVFYCIANPFKIKLSLLFHTFYFNIYILDDLSFWFIESWTYYENTWLRDIWSTMCNMRVWHISIYQNVELVMKCVEPTVYLCIFITDFLNSRIKIRINDQSGFVLRELRFWRQSIWGGRTYI